MWKWLRQLNNKAQGLQETTSGPQRITEQVDPTFFSGPTTQEDWYWGQYATGTQEDFWWRRLTDVWYQRDVIPSVFLELQNHIWEAYRGNPLAFAIIEQTTSFVLGEGIKVSANNKKVQSIIDAFWDSPDNKMEERIYTLCTELSLYGELFVHYFVNKYDGSVVIRQIDPLLIDQIETDPEDIEHELRFHRRPVGETLSSAGGDPPPITITQIEIDNQGTWYSAGDEVMHVAINKVSNAKRGHSDLATLLPWLRRYKDWLTDRVRINKYKGSFLWDVSLTGADKKTIDRKKMEYSYPPEPGSVLIHNEAEKWAAVQPNINAMDAKEDGRAIKMMVAVGATLPEHFLSDGDQGNRATAAEMSLPTLLKFKRRQRVVKYMLQRILDRVILEAQKAGKLGKGPRMDTSYEITFPEIDSGEHFTLAQATNQLVMALSNASAKGWISDETAMGIMFEFAGEEIDIAEEMEKVAAQQAAKFANHMAMQQAMQGMQQPGQQPAPGTTAPVPNQRSLDRQDAEANPGKVDVDTNGFGNKNQPLINYGATFGDGTKGLSADKPGRK